MISQTGILNAVRITNSITGCEIALNTGASATKFFTLVTKS